MGPLRIESLLHSRTPPQQSSPSVPSTSHERLPKPFTNAFLHLSRTPSYTSNELFPTPLTNSYPRLSYNTFPTIYERHPLLPSRTLPSTSHERLLIPSRKTPPATNHTNVSPRLGSPVSLPLHERLYLSSPSVPREEGLTKGWVAQAGAG